MGAYSDAKKDGYKPQIDQGTATTTAVTIQTLPGAKAMKLFNRSKTTAIVYSLDGGTTYLQCPALDVIDEEIEATSILIKTASGTAAYDLKVALRQ